MMRPPKDKNDATGEDGMSHNLRQKWRWAAVAAAAVFTFAGPLHAEQRVVRIAKQYGISYLPLTIMQEQKLLEAEGKKLGLDLGTEWVRFTGGPPMNEALISGNLDFASGGVSPLVTIWARTKNNLKVKGICALNSMPLYLNSINPNVKTIKDFTEKDRIALPAVRVSLQAVILQMAAEKVFGAGHEHKLDPWTVSLSHPDGLAQMMSFKSEITGHFT
jgi:NitT/TauT family transport system substrate-binding protein